ncbi:MAG: insulinase family protein [Verrucomicrobia bacterium]|jgi:zinc protease|nr:insulinase family protein [Verrucomicrobiota bacterium]
MDANSIPALPPGTTLTQLDNGLVIIVREDHSAPVVSAQAWCKAGSIHEGRWLGAGLSHVLEHMLFKGTTTRAAGRIDQEVQEAGGYMNAYTSFDRTVYHIDVPNTGATVALDILCDIMQHASLPPDELAKELDVIRREMDMGQDDPGRRSSKRLFETVYTHSPYRFPIIGLLDIFNQLQPEDIRGYYTEKYIPNNLFFVVAGDVKSDAVVAQIREAFKDSRTRALQPLLLPLEPRQTAPREILEEAPVELGHFHIAWHIPELRHPDVPVLDVLALLLGGGRSSRLFQQVREREGLVHSVDAWTYNPGNPGLAGVSAVVDASQFKPARDAILKQVELMQETLVTKEELSKAVKQFISGTLAARKTMQGQASDLGSNWLAAHDLNFSERYLAHVHTVTPDEIRRVARHYLKPANSTLYALLPTGACPPVTLSIEQRVDRPIQKLELPNGLRLLVKEDHRLPFVDFRAILLGGVLAERPADNGITQLMARSLIKGTQKRDGETLMREIESLGGHLDTYGANNTFGVNAEVLSEDFETGLELFSEVLIQPAFPADAVEREREIQLASIRDQRDHLLRSAMRRMRRELCGPTGYGLDSLGESDTVSALTLDQLRAHHTRLAAPGNCVLAIFGDVKADRVLEAVQRRLGGWRSNPEAPTLNTIRRHSPATTALPAHVSETRDKKQAVLVMGFRGTTFDAPDRCALELLQEACSDLGSRLFLRIRDQLGLAYYVGAQHMPGLIPGCFAFYGGTAPETVAQVEAELRRELAALRAEGLTEEELKRAKAKLVGQRKISRQELGGFASMTALDELYALGYDHYTREDAEYQAVTSDTIRDVANRYLRDEAAAVVVVGGPSGCGTPG